jgi:hypothetical protein
LIVARPDAGYRCADVEVTCALEKGIDLRLVREVGLHGLAANVRSYGRRPVGASVEVNEDVSALRGELAGARGADPARATGHEDTLPCEPGLHV